MCEQGKMPMPPDIDMNDEQLLAELERRLAEQPSPSFKTPVPWKWDSTEPKEH